MARAPAKSKAESSHRRIASSLLKIAFAGGLFFLLLRRGLISVDAVQSATRQWQHTGPAVAVLFFTTFLGVFRWNWLLAAQGIRLSWLRTLQLTLIGNFFNIALPGAVSGDFVKAFYIGREVEGKRARAFSSILFDRVAGLSALFLVSAFALVQGFDRFWSSRALVSIQVPIALLASGFLGFYLYLFLITDSRDPLLRMLKAAQKKFPKAASFIRIYEGLRTYHSERRTVLKVVLISVLIHALVGWACLQFAQALGETQLDLLPIYLVVPLGLLVTAIPIAPAGIGTGNVAFLYLFSLIGSSKGGDIFSMFAMSNLLLGSIGGLVYLQFKSRLAPVLLSSEA